MNKIKLTNDYCLLIPNYFERKELIRKIEDILDRRIISSMGSGASYSIRVEGNNGNTNTFLDIKINTRNNQYITTIIQSIEGEERYGKEVFDKEPTLLLTLCDKLKGLLLLKHYKTPPYGYCNLEDTRYLINYEKDSAEYKLIELLIKNLDDPLEILSVSKTILKNKDALLNILQQ